MNAKTVRYFALAMGILFVLVGVAGFIPGLVMAPEMSVGDAPAGAEAPAAEVAVEGMFGRLLGLFPINWLHNLVHIAFGIWGLVAYRDFSGARLFARAVAVIYAVLAVMGLIPVLQTTFGLIPLYGHDVWLHLVIAAVAAYFGFARVEPEVAPTSGSGYRT
jgi:hypothetical protein